MSEAVNLGNISGDSITVLAPPLSHEQCESDLEAVPPVVLSMSLLQKLWPEWIAQLPAELRTLSNLRPFVSKGPRGYGMGITTNDVMVGDRMWELEQYLYMGVIRWIPGESGQSGKYHVVGKALFFTPDGALVTPEMRKREENFGALLFKEDGTLIPKSQRKVQSIRDEMISLNFDIINLQKMTC
jgi:hypothetical protein